MLKFCNINVNKHIALWLCLFIGVTVLYGLTNNFIYFSNTNVTTSTALSNNLINIQDVPKPLTNFTEKMDVFSHAT